MKLKIASIAIYLLLFNINPMYCQNYGNTWVFGDSVGLNFNLGGPIVLTQPVLSSHESCSSISDSSGNLLFYVGSPTNFSSSQYWIHKVWDKNHLLMPNGDSLNGISTITQGSLIVPYPNSNRYYYIFTIGSMNMIGRYLFYSTIDMLANSGNGDVTSKNNLIPIPSGNYASEKMIAVRHGNGRDWWLIVHDDTTAFCKYLITPSGVTQSSFQNIGSKCDGLKSYGQMQISPNGEKLIVCGANVIDLYNFDRCTGTISNWEYLGDSLNTPTGNGYYGCSFSPNSQLLYLSNIDSLFQYDLNSPNIRNSKLLLFSPNCADSCGFGQHQISSNGKIYIANESGPFFGNYIYNLYNMSISYIENPNVVGLSCNFVYLGQYLGGKRSFFGLPNIPNYSLGPLAGSACDTLASVHELNNTDAIDVFYADNKIHIKTKIGGQLTFRLYNANGQIINSIIFQSDTDLKGPEVFGVYFYTILSNKGSRVSYGKLAILPN